MTELAFYANSTPGFACRAAPNRPRCDATGLTAAVAYSLSGATLILLAVFVCSI